MNDDTLESTLRDTLTAVASTTRVEDRWREIIASRARSERRPVLIAAAAFVVVLVTVGSFALVSTFAGESRDVATPSPTGTASTLRYPVLGYVPAGVDDIWAQIPGRGPDRDEVRAVLGRRTAPADDGASPPGIFDITSVSVRRAVPEDAALPGEIISTEGGRQVLRTPAGFPGAVDLVWTVADITGTVATRDGDLHRALAVVDGVRWSGDDPSAPRGVVVEPPDGLELIAGPASGSAEPGPMVTLEWRDAAPPVTVAGAEPGLVRARQVDVVVSSDSPEMLLDAYPVAESFELRGRPGYLARHWQYGAVIWEEAPGITVQVSGWRADITELISVAEGLEFTDEHSWRSFYDVIDPGIPPTTRAG